MEAAEEMGDTFRVEKPKVKADALAKMLGGASAAQAGSVADEAVQEFRAAAASEQFDVARDFAELAAWAARGAKSDALAQQIAKELRAIDDVLAERARIQKALARLDRAPADPEASQIAGEYFCFTKEDWGRGIGMLALGSDPKLKTLAEKELRAADSADAYLEVADGWWGLAQDAQESRKRQLLRHARTWYDRARPKIASALARQLVDRRLAEIDAIVDDGKARCRLFGVEGEGTRFVYVFDRSVSMEGTPLAAVKTELAASLDTLGDNHQFQIIFYNERLSVFNSAGGSGRLAFANPQNKERARKFVRSITADGGTRHEEALSAALRLQPDCIFFLTDGDEPRLSDAQLQQIQRAAGGIAINAIEFGAGPKSGQPSFIVKLASQNKGKYVYVDISRLGAPR